MAKNIILPRSISNCNYQQTNSEQINMNAIFFISIIHDNYIKAEKNVIATKQLIQNVNFFLQLLENVRNFLSLIN
jgi:hypothetical protein